MCAVLFELVLHFNYNLDSGFRQGFEVPPLKLGPPKHLGPPKYSVDAGPPNI